MRRGLVHDDILFCRFPLPFGFHISFRMSDLHVQKRWPTLFVRGRADKHDLIPMQFFGYAVHVFLDRSIIRKSSMHLLYKNISRWMELRSILFKYAVAGGGSSRLPIANPLFRRKKVPLKQTGKQRVVLQYL